MSNTISNELVEIKNILVCFKEQLENISKLTTQIFNHISKNEANLDEITKSKESIIKLQELFTNQNAEAFSFDSKDILQKLQELKELYENEKFLVIPKEEKVETKTITIGRPPF